MSHGHKTILQKPCPDKSHHKTHIQKSKSTAKNLTKLTYQNMCFHSSCFSLSSHLLPSFLHLHSVDEKKYRAVVDERSTHHASALQESFMSPQHHIQIGRKLTINIKTP